jgi:hypothetical protein
LILSYKAFFLFLDISDSENIELNEDNILENNSENAGDVKRPKHHFLKRKLQQSNISTPKKEESLLPSTPKSLKRYSLSFKQSDSSSEVKPLLNLCEKLVQQYLDEITRKLEEISVVDSRWDERLKSIHLLHSIVITPCSNLSDKTTTFSSHPVFVNAVTNTLLRSCLIKQFSDGRSSMIKSFCECIASIAYHSGVCVVFLLIY